MTQWAYRSAFLATGAALFAAPAHAQGQSVAFSKDVLPIFQKSCQNCHGVDSRAGLKLDTFEAVVKIGAAKGPVVIAGNADNSRLIQYIEGRLQPRMPLNGKPLARTDIFKIRQWIQAGAKDDGVANMAAPAADKPLEIVAPKDGSTVKELVSIAVPRSSVPPDGFIAVYIDNKFRVALAPPSAEEMQEKKLKADAPVSYVWDTKAPVSDDSNTAREDRFAQDGPHVIEVKSYNRDGQMIETAASQVNLRNKVEFVTNQPVKLWYNQSVAGQTYVIDHTVDLVANSASGGFRRPGQPAEATGGPDKIVHKETSHYAVSLEDVSAATGTGFWRERRESPLTVVVNGTKHTVRIDSSSRYYPLEKNGTVRKSKIMERESREPIVNPVDLPGRAQRMNEPFDTNLRINLGAYIPGSLNIDRIQATLEGIEWQHGERCVKIRLTYNAGKSKVDINSVKIKAAELDIQQGTSTIWFSETSNRVILAKHEVSGTLVVDVSQFSSGAGGGANGELGPGMGGPGMPGGVPYGAPGGNAPGGAFGAPAFGAPFAGGGNAPGRPGGPYGAPFGGGNRPGGNAPGGAFGAPAFGAPGASPYGAPGASPYGAPGASPYGAPGAPGAFGAPGAGGGTGIVSIAPTTRRYHVELKVTTQVAEPASGSGSSVASAQ